MLTFQHPRFPCPDSSGLLSGSCGRLALVSPVEGTVRCWGRGSCSHGRAWGRRALQTGLLALQLALHSAGFGHRSWSGPCVLQLQDPLPSGVSDTRNPPLCLNPSSYPQLVLSSASPQVFLMPCPEWVSPALHAAVSASLLLSWMKLETRHRSPRLYTGPFPVHSLDSG